MRSMMRGVVSEGSGRVLGSLAGPPVMAKTGTAEYGTSKPLKTKQLAVKARHFHSDLDHCRAILAQPAGR